jgi:ribosomal protein S18 acetylase RimI-like enzyme
VDPIRWSVPTRDDDAAWLDLLAAIEAVDRRGETYEQEDLDDEWRSVWTEVASDAVFGWAGEELVAFGWLKTQRGAREHHKVELWGGVRPSRRGRGIGRELLRRQLARAGEIAAGLDPALPVEARMEAGSLQPGVVRLAEHAGFAPVRRFLELARPVGGDLPDAAVPRGLSMLPWAPAWDEPARAAHTDAFADHWGSEPRTREEWEQWYTGHRGFRPDLSVVLVDDAGAVQSLVLCAAYPQDWHAEPRELWINTVATRRTWRGRGAARAALIAVLAAGGAAADGFERAILGVDSENPTGAVGVYRSLGFEEVRSVVALARPLRPAGLAPSRPSMRRALPRMIFSTTSGATPCMSLVATSLVSGHVESVWG